MKRLIKIFILFAFTLIPFNLAGFPSSDDETSLVDKMRQTQENDVSSSRDASTSYRKASEDKNPNSDASFTDMETLVWPSLGGEERIAINPNVKYGVGQFKACWLRGPEVWNFFSPYNGYSLPNLMDPIEKPFVDKLLIIPTIVTKVSLKGPGNLTTTMGAFKDFRTVNPYGPKQSLTAISSSNAFEYAVKVYENIQTPVEVEVIVEGVNFYDIGNGPVSYNTVCSHKTKVYPSGEKGCDCIGTVPTIYDDDADDVIASAGSVNLWVDSGGVACPPYTWAVSGTGWSLSKATTDNDLETNVLSLINTTGKTCGTNYAVYATVTVTDKCGVTNNTVMRYSGGTWKDDGAAICLSGGAPDSFVYSAPIGKYRYRAKLYCWTQANAMACTEDCYPAIASLSAYFDGSVNTNPSYMYFECASNKVKMYRGSPLTTCWVYDISYVYRQIWGCP